MSVHEEVQKTMRSVLSDLGADVHVELSPTLLANRTLNVFMSEHVDIHIEWGAVEHYKAIARRMLARQYEHDSDENEVYQGDMFSGQLQDRYPVQRKKGEEPLYKPRNMLSLEEITWNVEQLRKSATARLRHADALLAFRDELHGERT